MKSVRYVHFKDLFMGFLPGFYQDKSSHSSTRPLRIWYRLCGEISDAGPWLTVIPGLVNVYQKNGGRKDPPCDFNGKTHVFFDWAIFNSYVSLLGGNTM